MIVRRMNQKNRRAFLGRHKLRKHDGFVLRDHAASVDEDAEIRLVGKTIRAVHRAIQSLVFPERHVGRRCPTRGKPQNSDTVRR